MSGNDGTQSLGRICDFLVEDILSATDEEILQEAAEDYVDPDTVVASVQASIGQARLATARKKLSEARNAGDCVASKRVGGCSGFSDAEVKHIFKVISSQNGEMVFSIAARKGTDLTVKDMRSLLEDLKDLGYDIDSLINGDDG